jgi:hypothetical protein
MPRQNRVTPFGTIEASAARGLFMGNRGILHDEAGRLGAARWRHRNWVTCALDFRGRRRTLMAPGHYTELFFCDEAVALAAGHRPCAECRPADYRRFTESWVGAIGPARATDMDRVLHAVRVRRDRSQVRVPTRLADLPDGAFVTRPERPDAAWLVWRGALHLWSHEGYVARESRPPDEAVEALTPAPTLAVLAAGYVPLVHPTAG